MDSIKPGSNKTGLKHTFAKVLRLRASGVAPDDEIRKIKLPEDCLDSAQKVCFYSQPLNDVDEEKIRNREAMEVLLANLFASVSAVKAAYAQLQISQSPYDPECIQTADETVVSELKNLSELKHSYLKKQIIPSHESQLAAEIREQQNLLKTYEIMVKKLKSQLQLKESEILFFKEKLQDVDKQSKLLERRLNPNSSLSTLDNLHLSGLNPTHFIAVHHYAIKSIRSFVKLMMDEMESARWDIDAAASSIEPDAVYANPAHKRFAFEAYVCRKIFTDFQDPDFSIPSKSSSSSSLSSSSKQSHQRRHFFSRFMHLKSRKAMEFLLEKPESRFGKFCRLKYLSLVHPKMEASFFGDLSQRSLINSGGSPDTPFFAAFAEMAKRVWLLHCLGFSFEQEAAIFQVRKGCWFSDVYMESAAEDLYDVADGRPRVGFTVVPGFRVGKTVVQCRVYVSPV